MDGFVGPDSPISEPSVAPSVKGFVGPDSPVKPSLIPPSLLDSAKAGAKAAFYPLSLPAKVAQPLAEGFVGPDAPIQDPEAPVHTADGDIAFPSMKNYPSPWITEFAPTMDAFSAPFIAKDLAVGGAKLAKFGLAKVLGKDAAKEAFLKASEDIASLPAAPELALGAEVPSGSSVKPEMGLERLKTARKDPITGVVTVGHSSGDVQAKMLDMTKKAQADMEVDYADWLHTAKPGDRFEMGDGNYAIFKGGNEDFGNFVDVFGPNLPPEHPAKSTLSASVLSDEKMLKASTPPEATKLLKSHNESKGFVDAKQNFIGPDEAVGRLEGQGPEASKAFARELPFTSDKSGVVPQPPPKPSKDAIRFTRPDVKEINKETGMNLPVPAEQAKLPLGRVEAGSPTEPFKIPAPSNPMLPGGKERIAAMQSVGGTDIAPHHPFSTSAEMVTDVGAAKNVVRDQLQSGLKAEAVAEHKANAVFHDIKTKYDIKPDSLDSQVLSKYMRNPNKAEAANVLRQHVGDKEAERFINAEKDIRTHFDRWRNEVNQVRRANGMTEVPYKEDYLPQIHEFNTLNLLGKADLAGTEEGAKIMSDIKTDAEKITQSKFTHLDEIAFKHLKHQGLPDIDDAITGLETYGREAERFVALQPHINELRATSDAIKETMPNLAKEYLERADFIAGKQEGIDMWMKDKFGPGPFHAFVDATNRMKTNLIQGNPSVPVSQLFVLPSVSGSVPLRDSVSAAVKMTVNPDFRRFLIANSPTLQLRLEGQAAQGLHGTRVESVLGAPSEWVDQHTLLYGLGAKFIEGMRAGLSAEEAMKQAEQFASLTQATLSKLSTAPLLRSKTAQSTAPFMNQVLTQARYVTKQMLRDKSLGAKAATLAKFGAMGIAVASVNKLLLGDKAKTGMEPAQFVPMGPAVEQGIGGPVLGGAGRLLKSKSVEQALWQVFRNAMLYQRTIPAGLMVSKGVESIFRSKEKEKKSRRAD